MLYTIILSLTLQTQISSAGPNRFSINENGVLMWGNGFVCIDHFSDFSARVVCNEMGFGDFESWENGRMFVNLFNNPNGYVFSFTMDDLKCPSGASRLSDCTYQTTHNCPPHHAVRLVCFAPADDCIPGNSEFTEKMLARMDNAQEKFGDCAADISEISSSIGKLKKASTRVEQATEALDKIMEKVNTVSDKILLPYPKGLGVADLLGKIPKVGIFVKMGAKAATAVIDVLEPLADNIADGYKRVDKAVKVTSTVFKGLKNTATPTSLYLTGSHKILEAAHACGKATGYQCGTKPAAMEARNAFDYPEASERLDTFAEVGAVCHNVLSPVDMVLRELAEWAENVKKLLEPILAVLKSVVDFVEELDEKIDEFMKMISDSDEAQCALEIFEPVTDTINLLTCPISEVAGFVMHNFIDVMRGSISNMVTMAVTLGVNVAVEAIVPDNLYIHIPDFTAIIPVDFWVDTCDVAAVAFPGYATTVSDILALPLPYTITSQEIKESIITDALEGFDLVAMSEDYNSVCVEAVNEFGGDFDHCEAVLEKIADGLVDVSCQVSKAAYDAEVEVVKVQQNVYNAALDHFNDAQADFVSAQQHLADVYADLESAYNDLESKKGSCPSCRCGGCSALDFGCHIEGVWCCPARHGCRAALHIAQGGVELASSSVDLAGDAVSTAQNLYNAAAQSLTRELESLKHAQHRAELLAEASELVCNPPAFQVVKSGDCETNGLAYITERNECILAAHNLGVTHHHATPSGNRQKWCGTWGGLLHLHFNTQTTGVLAVGARDFPILQTAGNYGPDSWQLCKRKGWRRIDSRLMSLEDVLKGDEELKAPIVA